MVKIFFAAFSISQRSLILIPVNISASGILGVKIGLHLVINSFRALIASFFNNLCPPLATITGSKTILILLLFITLFLFKL